MIAAVVDGGRGTISRFTARGRDLTFWLAKAFPFCRFIRLPQDQQEFEFIFVFGPALLPDISDTCARELRRWLQGRKNSSSSAFAPKDKPFFIVGKAFLQAEDIALEPGIFKKLHNLPRIKLLETKNPIVVIDLQREPQKAEGAVTALQVRYLQKKGIHVENLGNFYMEGLPVIGRDSLIGSGAVIKGDSRIGRNVEIFANCFIENSRIGDGCVILPGSVIRDSVVEREVKLGPFCHLRNGSLIRKGAKMGNFVEMKKSVLGRGSKAMHLTYIGDAEVGSKVNIGAGTITCNYDGEKKNPTRIGNNVFIGSGTELVAPVTIHSNSYIGAGSTITEDVPRHALAIARQRQKNISGWVLRKRKGKSPHRS
jgi:serine acetyltransferase